MGHMVMCHATRVGNNVMLANASVINDGVNVGNNCLIGASSTVVPNMVIPDYSFVLGTPARIKSQISDKHLDMVKKNALSYVRRTKIYKKQGNFE